MLITGTIEQEMIIDPKKVIQKLIESEIDWKCWVFEKDGKFYNGFESGGGNHSWDDKEEITKERYDYVTALNLVLKYLENKKM